MKSKSIILFFVFAVVFLAVIFAISHQISKTENKNISRAKIINPASQTNQEEGSEKKSSGIDSEQYETLVTLLPGETLISTLTIDFSNDGYTRTNRRKASCNLKDTDHAKERYDEIVDLVRFGKHKLHYLTENEYYEGTIDPENGCDWNQTAPTDTQPTLEDFKKTVSDYLSWEVSNLLKNQDREDDSLGKSMPHSMKN